MDVQTKLMLICLTLFGLALVYGVLKVSASWFEHHVSRHNLIVKSKQRRYDYLKAKHDRDQELLAMEEEAALESVIIEDDEPVLAQAA